MLYSARCCVKLRTRNGFELAFTSACIRRREKMISGRGESENENSKDRPDQVRTIVEWFMKHLRWEEDLFVSSDLRNERSNVAVQRRTACKCSPSSHYKILTRFRIREGWVDFKGIENLLMSKVFLSLSDRSPVTNSWRRSLHHSSPCCHIFQVQRSLEEVN